MDCRLPPKQQVDSNHPKAPTNKTNNAPPIGKGKEMLYAIEVEAREDDAKIV